MTRFVTSGGDGAAEATGRETGMIATLEHLIADFGTPSNLEEALDLCRLELLLLDELRHRQEYLDAACAAEFISTRMSQRPTVIPGSAL